MKASPGGGAAAPTIDEIVVAGEPDAWRRAGFLVEDDRCQVGTVMLRIAGDGAGQGILAWSLRDVATAELDGLSTTPSSSPPRLAAETHPNGAAAIDHVVALSPDLDRTTAALERAGLPLRRVREGPTPGGAMRQAFFRLGQAVLEVIDQPRPDGSRVEASRPAKLWGLALLTPDLERCADRLGDLLGTPRPAVQPGRTIATLRRSAGLGPAIAFITPERSAGAA